MKLKSEQRKKILDMILAEKNDIVEELVDCDGCIEDGNIEAWSVFTPKDLLEISYGSDGNVEYWECPPSHDCPGEEGYTIDYSIIIESIVWYEPTEEDDIAHYADQETLDWLNGKLSALYYDGIRFY